MHTTLRDEFYSIDVATRWKVILTSDAIAAFVYVLALTLIVWLSSALLQEFPSSCWILISLSIGVLILLSYSTAHVITSCWRKAYQSSLAMGIVKDDQTHLNQLNTQDKD